MRTQQREAFLMWLLFTDMALYAMTGHSISQQQFDYEMTFEWFEQGKGPLEAACLIVLQERRN